MPKSRLGSPFNPLQRYAFLSYVTIFSDIFFEFYAYVCIRELCCFFSVTFSGG